MKCTTAKNNIYKHTISSYCPNQTYYNFVFGFTSNIENNKAGYFLKIMDNFKKQTDSNNLYLFTSKMYKLLGMQNNNNSNNNNNKSLHARIKKTMLFLDSRKIQWQVENAEKIDNFLGNV